MPEPQIVVLAAGMGSRYGGLKQIDSIGPSGEVLLEYSLHDAFEAGFERVVFVIRERFESDFRNEVGKQIEKRADTSYVFQELDADVPPQLQVPEHREKPWGTGHAVLCTRNSVDAPFAVVNADDFYGPEAFELLYEHLTDEQTLADGKPEYGMVGYLLERTLSEHGTVSRGLCEVNDRGELKHVKETEEIRSSDGTVEFRTDERNWEELDPETPVSMNCWGFTPDLFEFLRNDFVRFLEQHGDDPASEFYITSVVNRLLQEETVNVSVYRTNADWFGVTYGDDRETARRAIRRRIDRGMYETPLWT